MMRAAHELGLLLNYKKLSAMHLLNLPKIEKQEIPNFIHCSQFDKVKAKIEQTMERHRGKVNRLAEEIQQIAQDIAAMEKAQRKWSDKASTFLLDRSDVRAVEKQNHAAKNANRLLDQIAEAHEKRNSLIDKHTEAIDEVKEKMQELTQEALVVLDQDIVAVLDKCTRNVDKLCSSQNTEDLVAAIEICVMGLRVFALFEDQVEGNAARRDCHECIADLNRLFAGLCTNEHVRGYLGDVFQRNAHLVHKNAESYAQLVDTLHSVDQRQLTAQTQLVITTLGEKFDTAFEYEGVVDPAELEGIIVKIKSTIAALNRGIAKAKEVATMTAVDAQTAVSVCQNVETVFTSMKLNVEDMRNDLLSEGHFACLMIEDAIINNFYQRDLRPAVAELRAHLLKAVGEEQVDGLVMANEDRHALAGAENAIKQANLLRLQAEREKIDGHVKMLSGLIATAEEDIRKAGEVPQQNADALQAEMSTKYILSCIPGIGFAFGLGILGRVKAFDVAFRSTNQIYRELGARLLAKNGTMTTVVSVLGGLLGLGGMAAFFALGLSPDAIVNAGVPGAALVLYGITVAVLAAVGKRLRRYTEASAAAVSEPISARGESKPRS